jgi:serine/threonine-protein kinase
VEHERTGARFALKVLKGHVAFLDRSTLDRFRREARVSALVKSEHIVRVIDADVAPELDDAPFLVMDLLEGSDLGALSGSSPQPPEAVVAWLRQVARALDKAHALGIVHRDLKPENLFLARRPDEPPIIKILDFGIAKIHAPTESHQTATGTVVGTPLYMSREQALGAPDQVGPPTDMWAIAMIAFKLLAGREYWDPSNVVRLLADLVYKPIEAPSARGVDLGPAFDAWFLRSCHVDPRKRWSTTCEQVDALAVAVDEPAGRTSARAPFAPPRSLSEEPIELVGGEAPPKPPRAGREAATTHDSTAPPVAPVAAVRPEVASAYATGVLVSSVLPPRGKGRRAALVVLSGMAIVALASVVAFGPKGERRVDAAPSWTPPPLERTAAPGALGVFVSPASTSSAAAAALTAPTTSATAMTRAAPVASLRAAATAPGRAKPTPTGRGDALPPVASNAATGAASRGAPELSATVSPTPSSKRDPLADPK